MKRWGENKIISTGASSCKLFVCPFLLPTVREIPGRENLFCPFSKLYTILHVDIVSRREHGLLRLSLGPRRCGGKTINVCVGVLVWVCVYENSIR